MACPLAVRRFRILKPTGVLARKSDNEDVIPTVLVEIKSPSQKIIRILVLSAQRPFKPRHGHARHRAELQLECRGGGIIFMALFEIRPFPPPWPRDEVVLSVVVQVPKVGAFTPKL